MCYSALFTHNVTHHSCVHRPLSGVFQNAGQNCAGPERFIVYEAVYERFVSTMGALVGSLRVGAPLDDPTVDCGALRMPGAPAELERRVADAVAQGARLVCGGHAVPGDAHLFEPTLLVDVTDDMRIAQEEIFGPIMCVFKVQNNDDDEAGEHC